MLTVAVVAIAFAAFQIATAALPVMTGSNEWLTELTGTSVAQFAQGDGEGLPALLRSVEEGGDDTRRAIGVARGVGRFAPSLGWMPALDHIAASWSSDGSRIGRDLDAAALVLDGSARLFEQQSAAQDLVSRLTAGAAFGRLGSQAEDLGVSFGRAYEMAEDSRAARDGFWPRLPVPYISQAHSRLEDAEERLSQAAGLGQTASLVLALLLDVGGRLGPVLQMLAPADTPADEMAITDLTATLAAVEGPLSTAIAETRTLAMKVADAGLEGTSLAERVEEASGLLVAMEQIRSATNVAVDVLSKGLDESRSEGASLLGADGVLATVLSEVESRRADLDGAVAGLRSALDSLEVPRTNGGPSDDYRQLTSLVETVAGGLEFIGDVAPLAASFLGEEGKQFLVLGQSSDEVRATGGFVSSIWLITFRDQDIEDVRYHDTVRVDDWDRLSLYPRAPLGLEEHMNASVWLMRDVSWEPDFPTSARIAQDMFALGQGQRVDGVAAVTQWTLLEAVRALGGVPDPAGGVPITSRNLLTRLEEGTDQFGRAYMDVALQGTLDRLKQPLPLSVLLRLASAMHGALEQRELLVFVEDEALQAVVAKNGWDGSVREGADYLYVVDSNVGWSKADRNVERHISYQVDLRREEGPRTRLTLGYDNFSGPGSLGCEPQWLNRGTNYSELKNACYWNFFRVYVPPEARLLNHTKLQLPAYSVAAEIGEGVPGEDTVRTYSSYNKRVLSGLFELAAGERKELTLNYDLPSDAVERDGEKIHYELLIQKQPGVRHRDAVVELLVPEGYELAKSSQAPTTLEDGRVSFSFPVLQDIWITADFQRTVDDSS